MRKFTLRFDDDGVGEARRVEFDGEDPHHVFAILARERDMRQATLWEGEQFIARVKRTRADLWELSKSPAAPDEHA